MNILILILARKNSKRVPNKNIMRLGDKELIQWTIDSAVAISPLNKILVSTDDPAIQAIAIKRNVLCPWLRPKHLSTDTASSVEATIHAIDWYENNKEKLDGVLLLQPTSPFRFTQTLHEGISLFEKNSRQSVVGVSKCTQHPELCLVEKKGKLFAYRNDNEFNLRTQDLQDAYYLNGSFYLSTPESIKKNRTFIPNASIPLLSKKFYESIDIDTQDDFLIADLIATYYHDF